MFDLMRSGGARAMLALRAVDPTFFGGTGGDFMEFRN